MALLLLHLFLNLNSSLRYFLNPALWMTLSIFFQTIPSSDFPIPGIKIFNNVFQALSGLNIRKPHRQDGVSLIVSQN